MSIVNFGILVNTLGTGAVLPFVVIYLHSVRGIGIGAAGLVVGLGGAASVGSAVTGPSLLGRWTARHLLIASLVTCAAALAAFPLIRTAGDATVVVCVEGLGIGLLMASQSSLIVLLAAPERRHAAFAQMQLMANLGLGIGALLAGLIATASDPATFTVLFLGDACSCLLFAVLVWRVRPPADTSVSLPTRGYGLRSILRRRTITSVLAVNTIFVLLGVVPLVVFLPVYATRNLHFTERAVGVIFLLSTAAVVLLQLPISQFLEGKRRVTWLAVATCLFGCCWLAVAASSAVVGSRASAFVVVAAAVVLFSAGECVYSILPGALAADLAPAGAAGQHLAALTLTYQIGRAVGPATEGWLVALAPVVFWCVLGAMLLSAAGLMLRLERSLPVAIRRTPAPRPSSPWS